jgi:DEAD/DEAH box helicase domain-containing protein
MSQYFQRIGRAGRAGQTAYLIQLLADDPISVFWSNFPEQFFKASAEEIVLETENPRITELQLLATANDQPLQQQQLSSFEQGVFQKLVQQQHLSVQQERAVPTAEGMEILQTLSLRGSSARKLIIRTEAGETLGTRELPMSNRELFPEAIYLYDGTPYKVIRRTPTEATVRPFAEPWKTLALYARRPMNIRKHEGRMVLGIEVIYCEVTLQETVWGYILSQLDGTNSQQLPLEPKLVYEFPTTAILFQLPSIFWTIKENLSAFHAAEHVIIGAAASLTGASPKGLGGMSFPDGHILIHDATYGGTGLSYLLYRRMEEAFHRAFVVLETCKCGREDGCPACTYSPACGNNNQVLLRYRAQDVLDMVLRQVVEMSLKTDPNGLPLV